jgi:branched-chain amino acid transport system substrate-binding protein
MRFGTGRTLLVAALAMLMVAFMVTGCTSTDSTDGDTDGEAVTIKLGVGAPLTQGAVALGKGIERGAELAIEDFNNSPEAQDLGITVESFVVDDQGDPKVGVNVANQLTSDPDVVGVVGHLNSGVSIPSAAVYNEGGIVQVSPASTNPQLTLQGFDNVFRTCTIDPVQGEFAANTANDLGFATAFVVDDSTPYGEGLADEFQQNYESLGGETMGREKTSDKDTDFNALVTKIKGENPDVVYYGGIYNAGALFAKQLAEGGYEGQFFSGDGIYSPDYIDLAGAENAEGDLCTSVGLPLDQQPKGAEFEEQFTEKYGEEAIQAYDTYAFDATVVILEAIKVAAEEVGVDQLTSAEGKAAITAAVAETMLEGVTGEVSFDENGDTNNKAITLYVVENGEWVPSE